MRHRSRCALRDGDALAIADALIDELNRDARATGQHDRQARGAFVRACPTNGRATCAMQERVRFAYDASGDFIETLRAGEPSFSAGAS